MLLLLRKLWASSALRAVVIVALALGLVVVTHLIAYRSGLGRGTTRAHAEDDARDRAAVAAANAKYRAQEMTYEKRIDDLRVDFAKRQATELAVDRGAAAALASGAQRVRVTVTRCSPNPAAPGPASARVDGPETAELAPEVAATLYAIAADCDKNTRQLTALQAWALSAVKLCNGDTAQTIEK